MRSKIWVLLFLVGCSSAPTAVENAPCELGESRPFTLTVKKRGEVYVERTVGEECVVTERLVWGRSSLLLPGDGWQAGDLRLWKRQISVDMHQIIDGHPLDCRNRLYKFGKKKLELVKTDRTCGP